MTTSTPARMVLETLKRSAVVSEGLTRRIKCRDCALTCLYQRPPRKDQVVVEALCYRWTAEPRDGSPAVSLLREADVLALIEGETLSSVQARVAEMVGDPFAVIAKNKDMHQRGFGL